MEECWLTKLYDLPDSLALNSNQDADSSTGTMLQDEATKEESQSGLLMFGTTFPV